MRINVDLCFLHYKTIKRKKIGGKPIELRLEPGLITVDAGHDSFSDETYGVFF